MNISIRCGGCWILLIFTFVLLNETVQNKCRMYILYQNKGSTSFYLAVHFQGYLNKFCLHISSFWSNSLQKATFLLLFKFLLKLNFDAILIESTSPVLSVKMWERHKLKPLIPGTKIGHLQSWSILQDDSWPGTGQEFEIQSQSDIAT